MPKVAQVRDFLAQIAPVELAESWDNVGTLVDCGADITSVMVALDITDEVVIEAELEGCQLIVAHHPVIFAPLKSISRGDTVFRMIKKNISGICMHTNLDAAAGGVNDVLAAMFFMGATEKLSGMGRVGRLQGQASCADIAKVCKEKFGSPVRYVDCGKSITTLAVLGGAGGDFIDAAVAAGADCLLTGEASHHDAIDARHKGISLVVAGHFETEFPVVAVLADKLAKGMPGLRVVQSRRNKSPFSYL